MIANFTATENLPFAVALGLMLALGLLQTLSLLMGIGVFDFLDDLIPGLDADVDAGVDMDVDVDIDVDMDMDMDMDAGVGPDLDMDAGVDGVPEGIDGGEASVDLDADAGDVGVEDAGGDAPQLEHSFLGHVLGWLNLGRVPFVVSLIAFLFLFSCIGFQLQNLAAMLAAGHLLPAYIAGPGAFLAALVPLKWANALLGKILPHDETQAVSPRTFIGRVAAITIGECTALRPAEAKLKGPLGRTHYIMVLADEPDATFRQGEHVLIVGRRGARFTVIGVTNPNLEG